jgi:PAP2 superfamily
LEAIMQISAAVPTQKAKVPSLREFANWAFPHWILWSAVLAAFAINLIWIGLNSRISIQPSWASGNVTLTIAAFAIIAFRSFKSEKFDWFLHRLWCVLLYVLLSAVLTRNLQVFSHLLMTTNFPMADDMLMGWDKSLDFDWLAYSKAVTSNPTITTVLFFAYNQITFTGLAAVAIVLIAINNRVRAIEIVYLVVATAFACIISSAPFPALATMQLLGDQDLLGRLNIGTGVLHVDHLMALRGNGAILMSPDSMPGLISFPSFHTCMAIIIGWCSRGTRLTTALGSAAAIAILIGTPIFGGHYLVDVLSGAAITFAAIWLWRAKIERHVSPYLMGTTEKSFPLPKWLRRFAD